MTMTISLKSQIDMLQKEAETHAQDQQVFMATAKRNRELAEQLQLAEANAKWYLARAEAAEADNRRLAVRVAELEAALAAQGWRPVTEDWPAQGESAPVRMRNGVIRWGYRRGDRWHLTGGQYSRESVTHAYALPPAPAAQETTR